jgi:hypothetical protein
VKDTEIKLKVLNKRREWSSDRFNRWNIEAIKYKNRKQEERFYSKNITATKILFRNKK